MELHARYTFFAEGARGHLTKRLTGCSTCARRAGRRCSGLVSRSYGTFLPTSISPGRVIHTQGWPLDDAWGGGFLYHQENGQVALGFVVALDYSNPYLSPFEEFQRWKTHPAIRAEIKGGKRVSYGARAINEGGWQAIPKLAFPGGALIGCAAGFVNVPRIKGSHTAMKSGMLAAEAAFDAIAADRRSDVLETYRTGAALKLDRRGTEDRPQRPAGGGAMGRDDRHALRRARHVAELLEHRTPWTLKHHADHTTRSAARNMSRRSTIPRRTAS